MRLALLVAQGGEIDAEFEVSLSLTLRIMASMATCRGFISTSAKISSSCAERSRSRGR